MPTSAACLHTSAILQASAFRKRKSRVAEKANIEKRAERYRLAALNRPHVILGNRPGDDAKWLNCDLAKVVITEEQILAAPILKPSSQAPQGQPDLPKFMNYGVGEKEKQMLFETLPALAVEALHLRVAEISGNILPSYMQEQGAIAEAKELKKTSQLAALVDLRNANAGGIAYENRKRIVDAFSDPGKPGDTGRPEVQGEFPPQVFSFTSFVCYVPHVFSMVLQLRS